MAKPELAPTAARRRPASTAPARPRSAAPSTRRPLRLTPSVVRAGLEACYADFVERFWEVVEPETIFKPNWHVEYLAGVLQAEVERVARREKKVAGDVVINVPPRCMKSYLCTIMLNAWAWARWPWLKIISTSYSGALAADHAMKTRRIIQSELYQSLWGSTYRLRHDVDTKTWFENDKGGVRKTAGTGGGITGSGADVFIVDDAINPAEPSATAMADAARWWDDVAYSRLNDQATGVRLVIGQRLDERDLTAHVVEKARKASRPLQQIVLPSDDAWEIKPAALAGNYVDGLLWPERFSRDVLADLRVGMGSRAFANQMGQAPAPADGMIFKREWFKRYRTAPAQFDDIVASWDLAFKASAESSYVVGQVWGVAGADCYLLDQVRERLTYVQTRQAIRDMRARWPQCYKMLVEDKANGPAIIDDLRSEMGGLVAVPKSASKVEAAQAASPVYESGCVHIPEGQMGDDFLHEHLVFPAGRNDDQVDAAAQFMLNVMRNPQGVKIGVIINRPAFSEKPRRWRGIE